MSTIEQRVTLAERLRERKRSLEAEYGETDFTRLIGEAAAEIHRMRSLYEMALLEATRQNERAEAAIASLRATRIELEMCAAPAKGEGAHD